jgi:hypothetical protein
LKGLLAVFWGPDGAAQEGKTTAGDRDVWWKWRLRWVSFLRDEKEGLAPGEVEPKGGAISLHSLESGSQSLWGAHEGAIIEVPGIEREVGHLSPDLLDKRMEG